MTEPLLDLPILVVDDDPANVVLLERLLEGVGHRDVRSTTDPREVGPLIAERPPALVLLDLHMPHVDGLEVLQGLAACRSREYLPVIVLTADVTPEARMRALEAGATDFLTKPLEPVETRLRIRNALQGALLTRELADANRQLEDRVRERTAELERANEELRELDRLRRNLLSMATHEIRTPLTILRGLAETWVTRRPPPASEQGARELRAAFRNVLRLERLVDNFLLGARIEAGAVAERRGSFRLDRLLTAVVDELGAAADVKVDCPPVEVVADEDLLRQVVTNLVTNALRYGAPPVEVRGEAGHDDLSVVVRDHGEGIPDEFRSRLFEQFAQASTGDTRTATGTGLGLWIARRLAHVQGGEVAYREAEPTGAHFEVTIPLRR